MNYDLESIVIKVLANSSWNLIIPLKWYTNSWGQNCPYDWQVSVDNWAEINYSGTWWGTLTIWTWLVQWSEHLVIIKPTTVAYQWARAFGTDWWNEAQYITEIVQDNSYIWYWISATDTWWYFRAWQYQSCSNITYIPEENLPDTVTTIWEWFRAAQFHGTSITQTVQEVLPDSVITIWWRYRRDLYRETKITTPAKEVMSDNVTSIWTYFRSRQYYWCTLLVASAKEVISSSLTSIPDYFRDSQYYSCQLLEAASDEYLPEWISSIGNYFRNMQYVWCWIFKTAKEIMPTSITTIWTNCRYNQYYNCLWLKEIVWEAIVNNASIWQYYRRSQYYNCTALVKARLAAQSWLTNYRAWWCFSATTNPMTITILWNVVDAPTTNSASLTNASVDKIYVDSALVSWYKNSSSWSNINDDKFFEIWYIQWSIELLLSAWNAVDKQYTISGKKESWVIKQVLTWTENWSWDSNNNIAILSVSWITDWIWGVICSHWPSQPNTATIINNSWCIRWWKLYCYTTQPDLITFKNWLVQEYADWTPVIVLMQWLNYVSSTVQSIDFNTKDWENIIDIIQSWPNNNLLWLQIVADVAVWWYQTYMFNWWDYTKEVDWIEISDTQLINKQDKITEDNMLSADLVDDSNTVNKFVTAEDITNWNWKQDCLTAWPNITLSGATISWDFNFATSSTAAACTTKCVCIPEITQLCVWQQITVMPSVTATNCATNLKLNDFTAYPIRYMNAALTSTTDWYVWWANCLATFVFDWSYWHVVSKSYDTNTTYTLNTLIDAWKKTAWTGTYALSRYSLVMETWSWTWEKITNTAAAYSTATTKTVNTSWFRLGNIRYYNTTTNVATGALIATNTLVNQAASVDLRYSTNCWGTTTWAEWDYIYLVGKMWVDWLFYLDTTQRWTNTLPTTNDWKLYIRLWLVLAAASYTMSLLIDRPIFYYDNWIKEYNVADNKQDTLISGTNIKTINWCNVLWSWDLCIAWWVTSVNGQTWAVCLTIPTDNCELANWCWYQYVCNMVCDLTWADNTHYPTAKAVADAIQWAWGWDMMKSTYDPCNCNDDAFDYCNFHNTPTIPTDNCQLANGCGYTTCTWTLSSCADVISALWYTPYNSTNPCWYTTCTGTVSTCLDVITALGYTPYNVSNPCNYINSFAGVVSALWYTPYNNTNPCWFTTCTWTLSTCSDITTALGYTPYSNANPCWYTTCTGTLTSADLACYAQCCDIPNMSCYLYKWQNDNWCTWFTMVYWDDPYWDGDPYVSLSPSCLQFNWLSVSRTRYCAWCLESRVCWIDTTFSFDKTIGDGIAQMCDIPSVSGFVQESCVACVNWCCLTQWGNVCISWGWADYSRCTKTISWWCLEIWLRTIVNPPTSDFTLTVPATIKEWEEYVIRTISETSYCMCLGSCFTNPRNVDTCLSGNATDQYVFLAIWGELELQPLVTTGS